MEKCNNKIVVGGCYFKKSRRYRDPERIKVISLSEDGMCATVEKIVKQTPSFEMPVSKIIVNVDPDTLKRIEARDNEFIEQKRYRKQQKENKRKREEKEWKKLLEYQEELFNEFNIEVPILSLALCDIKEMESYINDLRYKKEHGYEMLSEMQKIVW